MSRILCVCNEFLTPAHRAAIEAAAAETGFSVRFFPDEEAAKAGLQNCEVLYAHSPALVRAAPKSLSWFCCSAAGIDPYCKDDGIFQNPDCLLSNSSGAYGVAISEHILMVTLMLLRRYPEYNTFVREHRWQRNLPIRSILGSRITVLGTGDLGTSFAVRARALGAAQIVGINRSGRSSSDCYDRVLPSDRLDEVLGETEILVLALPATPETDGILSRERIVLLPRAAIVVNVGRGSAIDQEALAEALNADRLFGAALDVVVPEPLPPEHPLWNTKHLLLTPHCSGDMALGWTCDRNVEMFCDDLRRYTAGQPLRYLADRRRGY